MPSEQTKKLIEVDPEAKRMHEECSKFSIESDPERRWELGIPHHPEAYSIFELIMNADYIFGDDYFCWKIGGDGDNGEILMYSLSILLELRDKKKEAEEKS